MNHACTLTKRIASRILAREGIAAIWTLHVAAAEAHRTGHLQSAAAILEIAEMAEEEALHANKRLRSRLADVIALFNTV
jgi:hypothetical protein